MVIKIAKEGLQNLLKGSVIVRTFMDDQRQQKVKGLKKEKKNT